MRFTRVLCVCVCTSKIWKWIRLIWNSHVYCIQIFYLSLLHRQPSADVKNKAKRNQFLPCIFLLLLLLLLASLSLMFWLFRSFHLRTRQIRYALVMYHTQRDTRCWRHLSAYSFMAIVVALRSITCTGTFFVSLSFRSFVRLEDVSVVVLFFFQLSKYLMGNQLGKNLIAWNAFYINCIWQKNENNTNHHWLRVEISTDGEDTNKT